MDGVNHIGFGVLRHLVDHFALADDERLAAAAHNAAATNGNGDGDGGEGDGEGSAEEVIVAEEERDGRAEDGFAVRERLTTASAEGDEGDDGEDVEGDDERRRRSSDPQKGSDVVEEDVVKKKKEEEEEEVIAVSKSAKRSSWKVWQWFSKD
jgi:hypothetical protein